MKTALACVCLSALVACGGQSGPPRHPVGEMSARATAKIELIDLVVPDPQRAERVRDVYVRIAALGDEFDQARARSILQVRSIAEERSTPEAQAEPVDVSALERMLAPPLVQSRAMFDRYAALMQQARSLLTADEFETLNRVR
ncbi:MAG TPA: hypothetical protein VJV78_37505 [Polyangiales bacterium]|nr:hypothetical protein [Polyangiales bacterium]